ncbi:glycoside hydrolase family 18 protein [Schleiferilactobacillus shenzhenensis]|uniref:chitinase n=1 Tax=Schleiferilactobacillus shenzhenensis LY-73 TaxID=1231336 RepID=U4TTK5_9LACO|nr:glycosyl hydrolase family 18 protein [Schleiferilactobacillus shenzhenensis]ERL64782.1 hypothetical protein L248_0559 [Schleiferilactobacillus shenzhenensis LY-73]
MAELIAYLDDNTNWKTSDLPVNQLTCINYAFAKFNGFQLVPHLKKINFINMLKEKHPTLRTIISVGGWGTEGFSDAVATKESRHTVIANLVSYMKRYNFDGIDIDWEYPGDSSAGIKSRSTDSVNLLHFLRELRTVLNGLVNSDHPRYWLTAAAGASDRLLNLMSPSSDYTYMAYLDYLNVMTYDMRGSGTKIAGHHTNLLPYNAPNGQLSANSAVQTLTTHKIPTEKIVIGSAFYSRDWFGFDENIQKPIGKEAATFGDHTTAYGKLRELISAYPQNVFWDDEAQAPFYFDGHRFSSYDDPHSMVKKAEYVLDRHLRGLMFWEYSLDRSNTLINAAANVLFKQPKSR